MFFLLLYLNFSSLIVFLREIDSTALFEHLNLHIVAVEKGNLCNTESRI